MKSSNTVKTSRSLLLFLKEPVVGQVHPHMATEVGEDTSLLRYQAQVSVLLQQLHGLEDTSLRICYAPHDAGEAIRFWLLPQLDGALRALPDEEAYMLSPHSSCQSLKIDFEPQTSGTQSERIEHARSNARNDGFDTIAVMGANALECGARWINMAMMMCEKTQKPIHGESPEKGIYLSVTQPDSGQQTSLAQLPPLNKIRNDADWSSALDSPLGAKLKKELQKLTGSDLQD